MLVILSDRDAIIQKKEMEHAQAVIDEIYSLGRRIITMEYKND